ncbi:MAG: FKBP-type peptidyl-prolyl cis-trans isomerase [Prevotella sp.]|jgi:FKBP-type peptidyl-prolyl cis-trans isomerase FklB|uniref:Peptidyl-prolyl cis-trans isomerase n=1 Tax=Segatella cerevisiae TaxID=2053716 RepID=A0ABT1BXH4_9BACT|nr:FKBP-type peptidyl-prolyl cis-trans isomerase [Segatella cerevisiae]MCH3994940.1 FKBP-type peptidyl-prolyl cis-trans isomerase [Prevotella sp.]MCI1246157.1 FKBP-type peptidyl-prolyl cis-trans isomerase [Prevotella sp.]MCO6025764.1 FKBP-type peptidyl-prolyl cis-trans isomerase [Segatella cerevisiae]
MKRIVLFSFILLLNASFAFAGNGPKKNKNKKKGTPAVTIPANKTDSLSYAAGIEATDGLIPFIQQSYKVDTAYMADFIAGYQEAMKTAGTPKGKAYITGMQIAQMVNDRILPGTKENYKSVTSDLNETFFNNGFTDALAKNTSVFDTKKAKAYTTDILSGAGEHWLAENAKKPGVTVLPDGLQYKVLVPGNGPIPKPSDEVEVVYEGRTIDGKVFDSTTNHGNKTDKFRADGLIKGWTEALTKMPTGSKWEIYVPQELAYGSRRAGQIPPYSTLIFDLELKGIVTPQADKNVTPATPGNTKSVTSQGTTDEK